MSDAYPGPRGRVRGYVGLAPTKTPPGVLTRPAEGLPGTRAAYFWEPLWPVGFGWSTFFPAWGFVRDDPGRCEALPARFERWGRDTTPAPAAPFVVGGRKLEIPARIPSPPRGAKLESFGTPHALAPQKTLSRRTPRARRCRATRGVS